MLSPFSHSLIKKKVNKINKLINAYIYNYKQISKCENESRKSVLKKLSSFAGNKWAQEGQTHKVEIVDPTADRRLILYSISLPTNMFYKMGIQKFIFNLMMRELIPAVILLNHQAKFQSFDFPYRLKADKNFNFYPTLDEFLHESRIPINADKLEKLYLKIIQFPQNYIYGSGLKRFLKMLSLYNFCKKYI